MSQIKLTLRPPPNVDFVHGFAGIPPQGERQQAAVKGAIEVRVTGKEVKAKWVRIELRKVETLPGGGIQNTFYDHVGPSPIVLWQSSGDYGMLHTQDFPFFIRIPESIPPSIALENRAGIKYELVASVCTKGKKGFLRRSKSAVTSTTAQIVIDKHELHSTWPVYGQHESRYLAQEGVNLVVERDQACYGPGDRVNVKAMLKSDSLYTVILRGFEITLKETTIFRTGPYATTKKIAPIVRTTFIGENKFPVNATLYGGSERTVDLYCDISPRHTTTTINAARHIDITYVLTVKALMGTGTHLIMNLPIILSNWPRTVSVEAIRRIGPASGLSLLPPGAPVTAPGTSAAPASGPSNLPVLQVDPPAQPPPAPKIDMSYVQSYAGRPAVAANTAPGRSTSANVKTPDEFGHNRSNAKAGATLDYGSKQTQAPRKDSITDNKPVQTLKTDAPSKTPSATARRPRSGGNAANRLTITNAPDEPELHPTAEPRRQRQPGTGGAATGGVSRSPWPTSEEEKQRLFENAKANVERTQGIGRGPSATVAQSPPSTGTGSVAGKPGSRGTPWPTSEEEKLRLYNEAQAVAKKTQAHGTHTAPLHGRTNSDVGGSRSASQPVIAEPSIPEQDNSYPRAALPSGSNKGPPQQASPAKTKTPQYPTAEQEKAALKRYHEAKLAVDRTQELLASRDAQSVDYNPVPYDSLYPSSPPPSSPNAGDLPPPFESAGGPQQQPQLSEKERQRKAFEARDAAVALAQQHRALQDGGGLPASHGYNRPSPPFSSSGSGGSQDARPLVSSPHLRVGSQKGSIMPVASGSKILTAIEEKNLLKARYDAEERAATLPNGHGDVTRSASATTVLSVQAVPAPPPLKPRPPVEYIQETQEEDERVARYVAQGTVPPLEPISPGRIASPFSARQASFGSAGLGPFPGPPPPLPPNISSG